MNGQAKDDDEVASAAAHETGEDDDLTTTFVAARQEDRAGAKNHPPELITFYLTNFIPCPPNKHTHTYLSVVRTFRRWPQDLIHTLLGQKKKKKLQTAKL